MATTQVFGIQFNTAQAQAALASLQQGVARVTSGIAKSFAAANARSSVALQGQAAAATRVINLFQDVQGKWRDASGNFYSKSQAAAIQQQAMAAARAAGAFQDIQGKWRSASGQIMTSSQLAARGLTNIGAVAGRARAGVGGLTGAFSSLGSVGGLAVGGLAIAIGAKLVGALVATGKAAAKAEDSFRSLEASANANGDGIVKSWKAVNSLFETNGGLVSKDAIADSIKNLRDYGYSFDEAVESVQRLIDRAAYNRQSHYDMSEAVRVTTEGIRNENSALSDATKISENLSVVLDKYAKSQNTTVEGLTRAQKAQATYNWLMRETASNAGDAKKKLDDTGGAFAKVGTSWDRFVETVGGELEPTFVAVSKAISSLLDGATWVVTKLRALDEGVLSLYNNAKRLIGLKTGAPAAGGSTVPAVPGKSPLPPMPANNSAIPPPPSNPRYPVETVDGPSRNTLNTRDNINQSLVDEKARRQREEDARKAAAGQLVILERGLAQQKALSEGELQHFRATQETKTAAINGQLKKQQLSQEEYARAVAGNEAALVREEERRRSDRIAALEKMQEVAKAASDPAKVADIETQLAAERAARTSSIEKIKKASIEANTEIFEAQQASASEARALSETALNARLDAERTVANAINDYDMAALDRLHEEKLISEDEYLTKALALKQRAIDQELSQQRTRLAYLAGLKPADKQDAAAIAAEQTKLTADVEASEKRKQQLIEETASKRRQAAIDLAKLQRELDQQLLEAEGQSFKAQAAEIDAWLAEKKVEFAALPAMLAKAEAVAARRKQNNAFDEQASLLGRASGAMSMYEQEIQQKVTAGTLTATRAEARLREERLKTLAIMEQQLAAAEAIATATGNPDQLEAIRRYRIEMQDLRNANDQFAISLREGLLSDINEGFNRILRDGEKVKDILRDIARNYLAKIADRQFDKGMDSLLESLTKAGKQEGAGNVMGSLGSDLASGFFSALQSGWSLVKGLFSSLPQYLTSALQGIGGFLKGLFSGVGSGGGWLSSLGSMFAGSFATGGLLQGPGTSTSDSILARLSRGEFVVKAASVGRVGVNTMRYINQYGRLPAFASGGGWALPSGGGSSGPTTVNTRVQPQVHITPEALLAGLRQSPEFAREIVSVVIGHGNSIKSAWA